MAEIRIEELSSKYDLQDNTTILVEDEEDTKKSTVGAILNFLTYNEGLSPKSQYPKFYNAMQIQKLLKMYQEGTNDPETIAQIYAMIQNLNAEVDSLKDSITEQANKLDHCGLISEYGTYQFLTDLQNVGTITTVNPIKTVYPEQYNYIRNSKTSVKIQAATDEEKCNFFIDLDESRFIQGDSLVSLLFFIDAKTIDKMSSSDGIKIMLSGDDSLQPENYVYKYIPYNDMVNGWNCVKYRISDFKSQGSAPTTITRAFISLESSMVVDSPIYLNALIFDQKMVPTLLLNFDGIYKTNGISYTYPYLTNKNIKATIFSNGSSTLSTSEISEIMKLYLENGWDLGMNESTNNKANLLIDNAYREQYTILRNTKENWMRSNFCESPIGYSTSTNIRNITIPILKDLNYKIARDRKTSNSYCSFFSDKDFCIPSVFFFNDTETSGDDPVDSESIKKKIDYIISTGQCMSLYTNDVSTYGSNVDASKSQFEAIMEYVVSKVKAGELQCLTFREFYDRCIN